MLVLAISDLALALLVGGATALGAGVGGAIAAYIGLKVEEHRQRFHEELQSEEQRKNARVAARLIRIELLHARVVFDYALDADRWGMLQIRTEQWAQHRTALAAVVTDDEWAKLTDAVSHLELFWDHGPRPSTGEPVVPGHRAFAERCRDKLETAGMVLEPYASGTVDDGSADDRAVGEVSHR